jgi:hypothetical protein
MAKSRYHEAEPVAEILERLSIPIPECGCWAWLGKHGTHGYPNINYRIRPQERLTRKTATVAWELHNCLEVPKGLEISHLCGMEWCVNPEHLVTETHSDNLKRRRPYILPSRRKGSDHRKAYQKAWRETNKEHLREYFKARNAGIPRGQRPKRSTT